MANQESTTRTLLVALVVCLVSSVFVAGAAVALKPTQAENRLLDKQRSILAIAGLGEPGMSGKEVKALFDSRITAKVVDLQSGTFSDAQDPLGYDPLKAAKDPALSDALPAAEDIASIKRRERYTTVYLVETDGKLDTLILPVRGYGLWSTLYGFLALKGDLNTVAGFGFTSMARPRSRRRGRQSEMEGAVGRQDLYDAQGDLAVQIIKGSVDPQSAKATHQVDGLAGATLTSKGVDNLLHFWLGKDGFDAFLANLRKGEA